MPSRSELKEHMNIKDFKPTEADVSALLYLKCIKQGYQMRMEARLPSKAHRSGMMRVDALVFHRGMAICIVEVKAAKKPPLNVNSRQARAYKGAGLPVFVCIGERDIGPTIDCINREASFRCEM